MHLAPFVFLAPALLTCIVSAYPGHMDFHSRSLKRVNLHRSTRRASAHGLARQAGCTATQCTSSSDQQEVTALSACGTDAACECAALEALSSSCLTCILSEIGLSETDFQNDCSAPGSSTACSSECSSASDQAANQEGLTCTTSTLGDPCICKAFEDMSPNCRACVLQQGFGTEQQYEQACLSANATSTGSASASAKSTTSASPTVTPSSSIAPIAATTTSTAAPTATPSGVAACTSQCTATDLTDITTAENCSSDDVQCQCAALLDLTPTCLSCVVLQIGITQAEFQQECAAASTTSTPLFQTTVAPGGGAGGSSVSVGGGSSVTVGTLAPTTAVVSNTIVTPTSTPKAATSPTTTRNAITGAGTTSSAAAPTVTVTKSGALQRQSLSIGGVLAGLSAVMAAMLFA